MLASESTSEVPSGQVYKEQEPVELAGTYAPGLHVTQADAELLSASVEPASHGAQGPADPLGAYVPAGHETHAVTGLLSISVVPAGQLKRKHLPTDPVGT